MRKLWFIVLLCSVLGLSAQVSYFNSQLLTKPSAAADRAFLGITNGGVGPPGPVGPMGPAGAIGPAGANGTNGTNGLPGLSGTNGVNGTNGLNGASSTNATTGATTNFSLLFTDTGQTNTLYFTNGVLVAIVPTLHPTAISWSARVVSNGGSSPSSNTVWSLSAFCYALDINALTAQMLGVCCFVPDNLIASITPLIKGTGNDPWANTGPFVLGDLDINGLKADGSTKYLRTGLIPSTIFTTDGDCGISVYCSTNDIDNSNNGDVACVASGISAIYLPQSGVDYFDCWFSSGPGRISGAVPGGFHGFHSFNRVTVVSFDIYVANSSNSCASIAHGAGVASGRNAIEYYVFGLNNSGTPSPPLSARRFSFVAFHHGLSLADTTKLFNCVQAMRTNLGGGYN